MNIPINFPEKGLPIAEVLNSEEMAELSKTLDCFSYEMLTPVTRARIEFYASTWVHSKGNMEYRVRLDSSDEELRKGQLAFTVLKCKPIESNNEDN